MRDTAFIRETDQAYDQPCDVAHVPLTLIDEEEVVAYLGTVRGTYRPTFCVTWKWVEPKDVWNWVASKGYQRKEELPYP